MNKPIYRDNNFWLWLIILFGVLVRLYKIDSPILDLYPGRQEQCAMIARNFFYHGFNFFHPEVDWFGTFDSSWSLEFPFISYLAALFYSIFGVYEFLGRAVTIIFSLASTYLVYKLAKELLGQRPALYAAFLFTISPLGIYFGRAFMPDMIMIFFSVASLYYFYRWINLGGKLNCLLALLATSLAFLIKLPSLYLCMPLLYLAYVKHKNKIFLKPSLYLFFIFCLAVTAFWYMQASNNIFAFYIANDSNLAMLRQPHFYMKIFEKIGLLVLTPIGLFLAIFGSFLSVEKKEEYMLHFWLLPVVLYTFIAAEVNYIHYHYQLPFVPIFSIFAAKAVDKIINSEVWEHTVLARFNAKFTMCSIMLSIFIISFTTIQPFYKWNRDVLNAARAVNLLTAKDSIIIAGMCSHEAPLYYMDRKGWETNEDPYGSLSYSWASTLNKYHLPEKSKNSSSIILSNELELTKFLIKHGANYYFTTNMRAFNRDQELRDFLYNNFKLLKEEKYFIIFDLTKK